MLAVVLALLVVVLGYVAYVFIDYHRIGNQGADGGAERRCHRGGGGKEYGILSYNIGFGAYEDDYSFFMDGGTESRAWSEERLTANIERIGTWAFLQQVEFLATWGYSSAGRALEWHSRGQRFDPAYLHQKQ